MSLVLITGCNNFLPPQPIKPNADQGDLQGQNVKLEATFESIKTNIIDIKCVSCHRPGAKGEDTPLETKEQILNGLVNEKPLVVPGKATESILYLVLLEDVNLRGNLKRMPPPKDIEQRKAKALSQQEIDVIAAWINGSATKAEAPASSETTSPKKEDKPKDTSSSNKTETESVEVIKTPTEEAPAQLPVSDPMASSENSTLNFDYIKTKILEPKCLKCHKPGGKAEDLNFQTKRDVMMATNSEGESILVVNKPESSLFYLSLLPEEADRKGARKMPTPKAVKAGEIQDITPEETKIIEAWIRQGAP